MLGTAYWINLSSRFFFYLKWKQKREKQIKIKATEEVSSPYNSQTVELAEQDDNGG